MYNLKIRYRKRNLHCTKKGRIMNDVQWAVIQRIAIYIYIRNDKTEKHISEIYTIHILHFP